MFYVDKTITKDTLKVFEDDNTNIPEGAEKWIIPPHYVTSGIFYVRRNGLVATTSFGTTKITVKCGLTNRDQKLDEFQKLLEKWLNS